MTGGVDEHGRLISDDGWYVWDGTQWVLRQAAPPPPPPQQQQHLSPDGRHAWDGAQWVPVPQPQPAQTHAHAAPPQTAIGIDLEAEIGTYPLMSRTLKGALLEVPQHLEPGEPVLATAPGGSWAVRMSTTHALTTGYGSIPGVIVVATDRRLLICGYAGMGGSINHVVVAPYPDIQRWKAAKKGFSGTVRGWDTELDVDNVPKGKLPQLRAVVEPRLAPGVVQA